MFTIVGEDIIRRESVGRLSPVDQVEATLDDLELRVGGDDIVEYVVDSGDKESGSRFVNLVTSKRLKAIDFAPHLARLSSQTSVNGSMHTLPIP